MSTNRMSVSTISNPEFINLEPLDMNPLMSQCEIKVLYVGGNRNGSFISKETAADMAKTLRGAPIVGWYSENNEDFVDHGEQIIIDGDGLHFNTLTKPYGFVAPDAQVWFQTFEETNECGEKVQHEYLMTTGYLWTGQYEEAKVAIDEGRPQSMELDNGTLDGHWTSNSQGVEFFIINDAVFSKLCILGEDVEPCFEGAAVSAPDVSTSFTLDNQFKQTLYKMMQELQFALEGGQQRVEEKDLKETLDTSDETTFEKNQETVEEEIPAETEEETTDNSAGEQEASAASEYQKLQKKYDDLAYEYDILSQAKEELNKGFDAKNKDYDALYAKYQELEKFKSNIEDQQKTDLINSFYMLSDEDKKDVIENKAKYTLDEIEAKLSVICVRNKVNFNVDEDNARPAPTTYNLGEDSDSEVPAWIAALRNTKNSKKN